MIVVDTNLLVYLHVEGEHTAQAERILRKDAAWAAPLLWRSEFRNMLAGLVRGRALRIEEAVVIVRQAEQAMAGREYSAVSHEVLQLAARSGCSAYDCEFVALAEDLGASLVTSDRRILKAFPSVAVAPARFIAAST